VHDVVANETTEAVRTHVGPSLLERLERSPASWTGEDDLGAGYKYVRPTISWNISPRAEALA
jgi:hypothetical protein